MDKRKRERITKALEPHVNALATNNSRMLTRGEGFDIGTDPKHKCLWSEFGYKERLTYQDFRNMYERQGIAGGAVDKRATKAFETMPWLVEGDEDAANREETATEKDFRLFDKRLGFWRVYMDCTVRRSVGNYSAMIIQIADDKKWSERAENVNPDDVVKLIPVWEHQLTVSGSNTDETSAAFGQPIMFNYIEDDISSTGTRNVGGQRSTEIHPSRVVWFGDLYSNGSEPMLGNLMLKKGYNDFVTLEKLIGAGGEGAYKNAARHLAVLFDKDSSFVSDIAEQYKVPASDVADILQEMARGLNSNFDAMYNSNAKSIDVLSTSLPDMDTTFTNALASAASSVNTPAAILAEKREGERASTEDQKAFSKSITSYRSIILDREIQTITTRFSELGMWRGVEWSAHWDSLLDASDEEKKKIAKEMAQTNQLIVSYGGEPIYTDKEIRVAGGMNPEKELSDFERDLLDKGEGLGDND